MEDVIIIGAGCAGLTASIYLTRAGYRPVLFERYAYGGQIAASSEVENYPGIPKITGYELAEQIYGHAKSLGVKIIPEEVIQVSLQDTVKRIITASAQYETKAVIIAAGVKKRKLDCPGEEAFTGRGVSYCATCDGAFFKGKTVAVAGGGNTAFEDALYLSKICKSVKLIHRRETFRADKIYQDALAMHPNIELLRNCEIREIKGDQSVHTLVVENTKENRSFSLPAHAIFVAIGMIADNGIYEGQITADPLGYLIAGEDCKTNLDGVFAAGDCRTKLLRQIITAAADGAIAGFQIGTLLNM